MESHSDHVVLFPSVLRICMGVMVKTDNTVKHFQHDSEQEGRGASPFVFSGVNSVEHLRLSQKPAGGRAAAPGRLGSGSEAKQDCWPHPGRNGALLTFSGSAPTAPHPK